MVREPQVVRWEKFEVPHEVAQEERNPNAYMPAGKNEPRPEQAASAQPQQKARAGTVVDAQRKNSTARTQVSSLQSAKCAKRA